MDQFIDAILIIAFVIFLFITLTQNLGAVHQFIQSIFH